MRHQQGISFFGVLFLIAVLGGVLSIIVKVLPPWMDFRTINELTKSTIDEPRIGMQTNDKILDRIDKQLSINNISLKALGKDAITLSREDGMLFVTIDYLVEQPVFQSEDLTITLNMQFNRTHETSLGE